MGRFWIMRSAPEMPVNEPIPAGADLLEPRLPLFMGACPVGCLVLACGNTLRSDDGVGPSLAEWAAEKFRENAEVRVVATQQWTPDLAERIAEAGSVLFVDSSVESIAGRVSLSAVEARAGDAGVATHHLGAAELLALTRELYGSQPAHAMLLTVGAGS